MTTYRVLIEHRKSTLSVIIVTIQMEGFWHEYFHWAISYVNADVFNWCCNFVDNVPVFKGKGIVFVPLFVREKANIAELLAILGLFSIEFGYFSFPWWFDFFCTFTNFVAGCRQLPIIISKTCSLRVFLRLSAIFWCLNEFYLKKSNEMVFPLSSTGKNLTKNCPKNNLQP